MAAGGIATLAVIVAITGIKVGDPLFLWQFAFAMAGAAAGLYVWVRQPGSRMGQWITSYAAATLVTMAMVGQGGVDLLVIGVVEVVPALVFTATLLAYPTGHVRGRSATLFVVLLAGYSLAESIAVSLLPTTCVLQDPTGSDGGVPCPQEWVIPSEDYAEFVDTMIWVVGPWVALLVWTPWLVWLLGRRARALSRRARRVALPFYLAAGMWVARDIWGNVAILLQRPYEEWVGIVAQTIALGVPLVLSYGAADSVRRRARAADLVVGLGDGSRTVRDALADALGDPTLRLALRDPASLRWVDERGRHIDVVEDDAHAVTQVSGGAMAVIHDADLIGDRRLIEVAGSAAYLALSNERLLAEREAQMAEIDRSRARIAAAADVERRRIERDLHDGAQQRLVSVGLALRLAGSRMTVDAAADLIKTAADELQAAIIELQDLARGIYPAVLTDGGLAPALAALTRRSPVPIQTTVTVPRLSPAVESGVYFVAAECLTNMVKHAEAHSGRLEVTLDRDEVRVRICDDGRGGAAPAPNSGLSGLADRVAALGGQLAIDSSPGNGTTVEVTIPCG